MTQSIGQHAGAAFQDRDGDGVAELQDSHVDYLGGDARNIGRIDPDEIDHPAAIFADPAEDAQTVIDNAPADALIYFDRENQRVRSTTLTLNTAGQTVIGLNAKLAADADVRLVNVTAPDVNLTEFVLDGNKANQAGQSAVVDIESNDVTAQKGKTIDASRHGILVQPNGATQEGVKVVGNRHKTPANYGTSVEGALNYVVRDVTVRDETAIQPGKSGVEVNDNAEHVTVVDCYARGASRGVVTYTDHGDTGCRHVTIKDNHADSCARLIQANTTSTGTTHKNLRIVGNHGEDLTNGDGLAVANIDEGLVVKDNTLEGVNNAAIVVGNCPGARIEGNYARDFPNNYAILVQDCESAQITDNSLFTGQNGIRVEETDGSALEDFTISDNRITGVSNGIVLREGTGGSLGYYRITDNQARGNTTAADLGGNTGVGEKVDGNIPTL